MDARDLPFGTPLVIANPTAGDGRVPVVTRLLVALRERGVEPDLVVTAAAGHAGRLAQEAALDGRGLVVAVGGDGTVNEVVNGLFDPDTGSAVGAGPVLGVVGAGSGSDLMRTFGLDRSPEVLADHLITANLERIDLGRAEVVGPDGATRRRLFVNVAEAGYGGTVTALANRMPRFVGRRRYEAAIVASVLGFRRVEATITVDGGTEQASICNALIANGQFFGSGLHVAPRALPADGRFDVQAWGGRPIDVIRAQPQLRRGRHLERDDVQQWRSRAVTLEARRPLVVEADGEVLGTTPARFEVLPGALTLKV
ncbi:MAG: diacylglycerol/lipid kinase family protein [Actinomycetota bacterium]